MAPYVKDCQIKILGLQNSQKIAKNVFNVYD